MLPSNINFGGGLLPHQGIKSRLHNLCIIDSTCVFCGKDETVPVVFWKCQTAKVFWAWIQAQFHSLFAATLSWKGTRLGDTWLANNTFKLLGHSIHLVAIGLWHKHHCKLMFNEDPYPLTLENSRSFREDLALLLRVHLDACLCNVESLSMGLGSNASRVSV